MEISKDSIILKPQDNIFDLVGLFDIITPALVSSMITKNVSILHIPHMKEDLSKKGFFVKTNDKKAKIVLGREFDPCMYRGQCNDFEFIPKFQRINNEVNQCIEYIKREEFKELFKKTPYYKVLTKIQMMGYRFDIDLDAIAQHYDFATNYLDITKDIKTALFFAYTDCINGNYFPIENFKEYHPHLYIANFAFLEMNNLLTTVGFQGVLRPQKQLAMALDTSNAKNNIKSYFHKVKLVPDRDVAYGIFKSFNDGRDLFPDEPINNLSLKIKNNSILSNKFFEKYCKLFQKDPSTILKELEKNYELKNNNYELESDLLLKMEHECTDKLLLWIVDNISYRKIKHPNNINDYVYIDAAPQSLDK